MVPGIAVVQDVLEVFFEVELGNRKYKCPEISLEDGFLVSRHIVLG